MVSEVCICLPFQSLISHACIELKKARANRTTTTGTRLRISTFKESGIGITKKVEIYTIFSL